MPAHGTHDLHLWSAFTECATVLGHRFPPSHPPHLLACSVAAEEEEAAMAERRQDLFTLFRNTASLARPAAYSFVGGRLGAAVGGGAAWQDVEVAVSLLYQLGEGAPEGDTKPGTGVLAQLAAGIMATEVRTGWRVGWAGCCATAA